MRFQQIMLSGCRPAKRRRRPLSFEEGLEAEVVRRSTGCTSLASIFGICSLHPSMRTMLPLLISVDAPSFCLLSLSSLCLWDLPMSAINSETDGMRNLCELLPLLIFFSTIPSSLFSNNRDQFLTGYIFGPTLYRLRTRLPSRAR